MAYGSNAAPAASQPPGVRGEWEAASECGRGDTLFCHLGQALTNDSIDAQVVRRLRRLYAVHDIRHAHKQSGEAAGSAADPTELQLTAGQTAPSVAVHPVLRAHPVTGALALYINPGYTTQLYERIDPGDGTAPSETPPLEELRPLDDEESAALLEACYAGALQRHNCTRYVWQGAGELVLWDNATVMHRATTLDMAESLGHRIMLRASVAGGTPRAAQL